MMPRWEDCSWCCTERALFVHCRPSSRWCRDWSSHVSSVVSAGKRLQCVTTCAGTHYAGMAHNEHTHAALVMPSMLWGKTLWHIQGEIQDTALTEGWMTLWMFALWLKEFTPNRLDSTCPCGFDFIMIIPDISCLYWTCNHKGHPNTTVLWISWWPRNISNFPREPNDIGCLL